ncbi:Pnap_2097 family protein [Azospirillum sp. B506]|uniref:Pnap_2097 family protein n=1 Tax=Azospirillum sp. B506 TaxID=137721 RepID=UPI000344F6B6|nr:Pnap_2097 family protein [Azospirillum sp. B506]
MSVALTSVAPIASSHSAAIGGPITVGMPQLGLNGLSEHWLLKECGHRHWLMLADLFGQPLPDFRDSEGATLYATFTGLSLDGARLDEVAEHDRLAIDGRIVRTSRTQYLSIQTVHANGRPVGTVTLQSIFLKRAVAGDNLSVLRALPHPAPRLIPVLSPASPFAARCQRFRRDDWDEHWGFRRTARQPDGEILVDPCPAADFNGAGFLYFASFPTIMDRADWALERPAGAGWIVTDRDVFYYGNINPGDRVIVRRCGVHDEGSARIRWFDILRESDGKRIADGFWRKTRPAA